MRIKKEISKLYNEFYKLTPCLHIKTGRKIKRIVKKYNQLVNLRIKYLILKGYD